jgi:hypothetical protein
MKKLAFIAVVFVALAAPTGAGAALFFVFDQARGCQTTA